MKKQFLTKREVAQLLRVTPRTVERYASHNKIRRVTFGGRALFPVAQFEALALAQAPTQPQQSEAQQA